MKTTDRAIDHKRNDKLEKLLQELNELLAPAEKQLVRDGELPTDPVLFIVGPPRSGSTLFMQWLAQSGHVAYPTNLLSRFYKAPVVGAKIQRMLADPLYDFRGEFAEVLEKPSYTSSLGKTQGLLAPNEFWYFWRRFFPNEEPRQLQGSEVDEIQGGAFCASIAALEREFQKPIAMKALIMQLNLDVLAQLFTKVLFVCVHRDPIYTMQSLLDARESYFGSRDVWYSIKPPEFEWLQHEDVFTQVAGQVLYTNRRLEELRGVVKAEQWLTVEYEAFCKEPEEVFANLKMQLEKQGLDTSKWAYQGPGSFDCKDEPRLAVDELNMLQEAYSKLEARP